MTYFFFGTLRDRDMLDLVVGRHVADGDVEPGTLPRVRLLRVADEAYPALVPHAESRVEGVRVTGLTVAEVERIAWFEGKEYALRTVDVVRADGGRATAQVHVASETLELVDEDWDFARWRRTEKDLVMTLAREHMALRGRVSLDEAMGIWGDAETSATPGPSGIEAANA